MAEARIWVVAGPEFRAVGDALRQIDSSLPTQFRQTIKRKVKPYVQEVKQDVRHLPTPMHAGHTGLRRRVASGVRIQAKLGRIAGVRIVTTVPNATQSIIPRGLDSRAFRSHGGGWYHPVFGHGSTFQKGYSWFVGPLSRHADDMKRALADELDNAAQFVAAHGGSVRRT